MAVAAATETTTMKLRTDAPPLLSAIFRRRHSEPRLECAIERPDGAVAAIERDGEHGKPVLRGVRQALRRFLQGVVVQDLVEVAIAGVAVDRAAQQVFLRAELAGEGGDAEAVALPELPRVHRFERALRERRLRRIAANESERRRH